MHNVPRCSTRFIIKSEVGDNFFAREYDEPNGLVIGFNKPYYDFRHNILYLGNGEEAEIYCPKLYVKTLKQLVEKVNKEMINE